MHGLDPSSLSRGLRLAYGVTPKRCRFEQMASRAARGARETREALSMIAAASGFADESHMDSRNGSIVRSDPETAAPNELSSFKTERRNSIQIGTMMRRFFLQSAAAAGAALSVAPLHAASTAIRTKWIVRGSEGLDALSFLSPLSGDPFYLEYYKDAVAQFAPRIPPRR